MLAPWQEEEVYQRLDQLVKDMKEIDIQDVAFFLVRNEPVMSERLIEALEKQFFKQRTPLYNDY
ncbi:hypothetical protein UFOVP250_112 [uncultured Caudovirales phage]|uniref:Uncharacterized protein n=1 Tax=uncultured Caudovirales phage TaxID=2100421 RepID=A0A6J5LJZ3_9CAUD|nr:hypothetical protein UFOVP250_112 [uncultured Caudovirales phage]